MDCGNSTPLRCAIEIPLTSNPANCDAEPCGMFADIICKLCGLPICSACAVEFPCFHAKDGKHIGESELDLYRGRVQPDYRNAAVYRKASIQAAKETDFRGTFLAVAKGGR